VVNQFGRKGNRLTNTQKRALKLTPRDIINKNVRNLNMRELPPFFLQEDLTLLTDEFKDFRLVINIPYNRLKYCFHDYAFVLFNDCREAADFCKKWDGRMLVDALGESRRVKFHKGNNSPQEFLKRILKSKSVFDQVKLIRIQRNARNFF
jgi:hypothetical protein